MTKPAYTRSLVIERLMAHPPEKIRRALTQGPLIEEWLMKNDFPPVVGHRFNFRATPKPHWNRVLAKSWSSNPMNGASVIKCC